MVNIGITVNNIVRNHIPKLEELYLLYSGQVAAHPINPYDLEPSFPSIENTQEDVELTKEMILAQGEVTFKEQLEPAEEFNVYKLMYTDASFEIFAACEETHNGAIKKISALANEKNINIVFTNLESQRSKCATLYFLSKNFFDLKEVYLTDTREDMWDRFDVLVTDDPKLLQNRGVGKKTIKVCNFFNESIDSDYSINNIMELVDNYDEISKIIYE